MMSDSYEGRFQAKQHHVVCSGCGEPADAWLGANVTTPSEVRENEAAAAGPLPEASAPRERLPRPALGLAFFSPSAWRIQANQAWAIIDRVM